MQGDAESHQVPAATGQQLKSPLKLPLVQAWRTTHCVEPDEVLSSQQNTPIGCDGLGTGVGGIPSVRLHRARSTVFEVESTFRTTDVSKRGDTIGPAESVKGATRHITC